MRKAFCVLLFLAACAAAQTVEGTVVDSVTGNGIASVRVFLIPVSGETDYSATTDPLGHFLFKGIKAGTYTFGYALRGYLPSDPFTPSRQVRVTGDEDPLRLEARMSPLPRISGRVVDGDGNGVANARVEVIPEGSSNTTTDATGKFDLPLDQRGAVILAAVPPIGLKPPDPEPDSGRVLVWTRTFYPGVPRLESASRIVASGGELSGIEMKLLAVPAHAIRGVLLNPDGTPAPQVAIALDDGQPRRWQPPAPRAETNSDGVFEFPQVVDGTWRLAAEVESGGVKLRAGQWIDMAGHELEGIDLRLAAPFTVRGRVAMETPKGAPGPDPFPVFLVPHVRSTRTDTGMSNWMLCPSLHFEPAIPRNAPEAGEAHSAFEEITTNEFRDGQGAILATPHADGGFSLENVYPGSYRIVSLPPPPPYYMAAVRIGETEVTTAEVELSSGAAPVTVVYKTDGGSVRGTAEKCASGLVLLIPQDAAVQSLGFLRSARCDSSDRYELTAVRPGDYYALAFAGNGGIPQLDDILIGQAVKVTVHANETTAADLRAIPRPGY